MARLFFSRGSRGLIITQVQSSLRQEGYYPCCPSPFCFVAMPKPDAHPKSEQGNHTDDGRAH